MLILTPNNTSYDVDIASAEANIDIRYAVLDLSITTANGGPDFFFYPLIFLEGFNCPAVVLKIGKNRISLPYDWYIVIGDQESGDLEMLRIEDFNNRDFSTPVFNPLSDSMPTYEKIEIENTFNEVRWFFPKLSVNNILAVPLRPGKNPPCIYCVSEIFGKKLDTIPSSLFYS